MCSIFQYQNTARAKWVNLPFFPQNLLHTHSEIFERIFATKVADCSSALAWHCCSSGPCWLGWFCCYFFPWFQHCLLAALTNRCLWGANFNFFYLFIATLRMRGCCGIFVYQLIHICRWDLFHKALLHFVI